MLALVTTIKQSLIPKISANIACDLPNHCGSRYWFILRISILDNHRVFFPDLKPMDKAEHKTVSRPIEILCPACGQDTLVKRESVYEGFKRSGEKLSCAACGHVFANEAAVPFKAKKIMPGFGRQDVPPPPKVFGEQEVLATVGRLCRHCAHYVVNPFLQRCGRSNREVEATDTCDQFTPKNPPEPAP